jgi:acyl carrier protein
MGVFMDDLAYRVQMAVAECAGIPFASVEQNATLAGDLDLDSLELVNLAQDLEEEFDVELPDSDIRPSMTVADLVSFVSKQKQAV